MRRQFPSAGMVQSFAHCFAEGPPGVLSLLNGELPDQGWIVLLSVELLEARCLQNYLQLLVFLLAMLKEVVLHRHL